MNRFETIRSLKGVGAKKEILFHKLNIFNVNDLLEFFPNDYETRVMPDSLENIVPGEKYILKGEVMNETISKKIRQGLIITKVKCRTLDGMFEAVWFNIPYLRNSIKPHCEYYFFGKVERKYHNFTIENPEFNKTYENLVLNEIMPRYSLKKGISQKDVRKAVYEVLKAEIKLEDCIPDYILKDHDLLNYGNAIKNIHYPENTQELQAARRRLVVDEFLEIQAGFKFMKKNRETQILLSWDEEITDKISAFTKSLPYLLTDGQKIVLEDIIGDIKSGRKISRLMQGDVGSGKTIVALIVQYIFYLNGFTSVLMVPTAILAEQHFETATKLFEKLGVSVLLMKSFKKSGERLEKLKEIKGNKYDMIIGTHSLIQQDMEIPELGLVITDEQHRFGVEQRNNLVKKGLNPHTIVMSATPIPRTISHVMYGDLDVSVIHGFPAGRKPVKTYCQHEGYLERVFRFVLKEIQGGRQAFIVCPEIDISETDKFSVLDVYERLRQGLFSHVEISMIHGKMNDADKEKIMNDFSENKIKLLISTTVIEVGIDIPNASVIVILDADRFGLATLHQLRGRVGRGSHESYCVLITDSQNETTLQRMNILTESNDGFYIAEKDLEMRGPGDYFGFKQHGLPNFQLADLSKNSDEAQLAKEILERLESENDTATINSILKKFTDKISNTFLD
ncbi:MAG: ATP-dependent DNA helicase RecG [Eubacteriaceae bacterium]|nr:ATP-dependent DNA helicase RecG [Eubacteriaceae bacterium]